MLMSKVPVYKIKEGMRLRDPDTGMLGEITFVEHEFGDVYSWVKWDDDSGRRTGFWGNHVDYEVLE